MASNAENVSIWWRHHGIVIQDEDSTDKAISENLVQLNAYYFINLSCTETEIFRGIQVINTLSPRQNGRHFLDDIFKPIFLNKNVRIAIKISLKIIPRNPIDNESALVQVKAWLRTGDKPLHEPMLTQFTDAYMRH